MILPLRYFLKEALSSFSRGGAMSLVAVLALTLASMALGSYTLLRRNSLYWLDQAEHRFEAVVYLKDGIDEARAKEAAQRIRVLPGVTSTETFVPNVENLTVNGTSSRAQRGDICTSHCAST